MSEAEMNLVTRVWNKQTEDSSSTPQDPEVTCIHKLLVAMATNIPSAPAVIDAGITTSYAELDGQADAIARFLLSRGVTRDTTVVVCMRRSAGLLACIHGILRAGGAYVPVEPSYPPERISFMIRDSGATIALVDKTSTAGLSFLHHDDAGVMPNVVVMDDILDAESSCLSDDGLNHSRANRLAARGKCDGSSLAYVIYTSGTTGRPKGVLVEHRGLVNDIVHVRDSMLTAADFSRA